MRLFLVTAACAAALALPVLADPTAPPTGDAPNTTATVPATTASKAEPDVICKMKQVTGSRFGVKVCTTKVQRDEQAAQARDMLAARPEATKPPGS